MKTKHDYYRVTVQFPTTGRKTKTISINASAPDKQTAIEHAKELTRAESWGKRASFSAVKLKN
jgi:hypothetical protein